MLMMFCSDEFKSAMFKKHSCYFDVKKQECIDNDFSRMDEFMAMLERAGKKARQKVLLTFADDYKEDKRELIFIPEVIGYIKAYAKKYPYFWYYVMPADSIYIPHVFLTANAVNLDGESSKYALNVTADTIRCFAYTLARNLQIYGESIHDIEGSAESFQTWIDTIMQSIGEEPTGGVTVMS